MHWSVYILVGAIVNALVNYGYKLMNGKADMILVSAVVYGVSAIGLLIISAFKGHYPTQLIAGGNWIIPVIMGIACIATIFFFIGAITKGPIALVDPLWACIYALASVAIGLLILKENPSAISLCGVGLYLLGAFLMAKG